jgi:hypothetical protein
MEIQTMSSEEMRKLMNLVEGRNNIKENGGWVDKTESTLNEDVDDADLIGEEARFEQHYLPGLVQSGKSKKYINGFRDGYCGGWNGSLENPDPEYAAGNAAGDAAMKAEYIAIGHPMLEGIDDKEVLGTSARYHAFELPKLILSMKSAKYIAGFKAGYFGWVGNGDEGPEFEAGNAAGHKAAGLQESMLNEGMITGPTDRRFYRLDSNGNYVPESARKLQLIWNANFRANLERSGNSNAWITGHLHGFCNKTSDYDAMLAATPKEYKGIFNDRWGEPGEAKADWTHGYNEGRHAAGWSDTDGAGPAI